MDTIYLDHNATTPIDPRVAAAIADCYRRGYVNPASQHRMGQAARRVIEEKRTEILERLGGKTDGMDADQLIFTSGGTESNNLVLFGLPKGERAAIRILLSAVEHPSILAAGEKLKSEGATVELIPVDQTGRIQWSVFENMLETPADLVSIMLANNETGVIEPVQQAADLCREKGVLFHTDAVQAVGKLPIGFRELGVDALTFTAHKFHGPRGIGALVVRAGLTLDPQLFGGFQQMGIRPGTEDVAMVVGMARALEIVCGDQYQSSARMEQLRNQLQSSIAGQVPDVVISGTDGPLPTSRFSALGRVPHTLNISFPGLNRQEFLMAADMRGLAISTGSACASGSSEQSHVLIAMGAAEAVIDGSIRISLGIDTTESQIDEATRRIIKLVKDLRRQNKD